MPSDFNGHYSFPSDRIDFSVAFKRIFLGFPLAVRFLVFRKPPVFLGSTSKKTLHSFVSFLPCSNPLVAVDDSEAFFPPLDGET